MISVISGRVGVVETPIFSQSVEGIPVELSRALEKSFTWGFASVVICSLGMKCRGGVRRYVHVYVS